MSRQLTIVVPCTNRKTVAPISGCRARELPDAPVTERHREWLRRLEAEALRMPLERLYAGDAWARAMDLQGAARDAGFDPDLFVASAGLGLVHISEAVPAYGATFDQTSEDAVSSDFESARSWWNHFQAAGGKGLRDVAADSTLIVLSASYAVALDDDLHDLAAMGRDTLLIGGHTDIPGLSRLPADLSLRAELGGTASSLLNRMAATWLSHTGGTILTSEATQETWDEWASTRRRQPTPRRETLTDAEVRSFVKGLREANPRVSKSRALRALRDHGHACEQRRFGSLYAAEVKT